MAAAWAITPAGFVAQAEAREEILTYETLIDVEIDGDFIVTERITVRAEGFEISAVSSAIFPRFAACRLVWSIAPRLR